MGWGTRHTFILVLFFGRAFEQAARVNLSVAIVAMVNQGSSSSEASSSIGTECPFPEQNMAENATKTAPISPQFDWDAQDQGLVLGAFYYGFIFTMLPGGYLAERFGPKWVMFVAFLGASLCSLLSPVAAVQGGTVGLIALKVIQGLFQGPIIPGSIAMISNWIPPSERSKAVALIWGGEEVGILVAFPLCGFLAETVGWEWDFYIFGIIGLVYCLVWILLAFSRPDNHPRISKDEQDFIDGELVNIKSKTKLPLPPYGKIFTSIPFWALAVSFICSAWGWYTLLTEIPTYLNNIQHISLTLNGVVSAVPYLLAWLWSIPMGLLADWLISGDRLSRAKTRKLMTFFGFVLPAIGLIILTFIGCNPTLAVTLLCLSLMFEACMLAGFNVNQLELSPNYAGTLRGATSTLANMCGFATPTLIGYLTQGDQTIEAWNKVFYTAAGVMCFGAFSFIVFGRTSVQDWNTYWVAQEKDEQTPLLRNKTGEKA